MNKSQGAQEGKEPEDHGVYLKGWDVRGWTVVGAEPLGKGARCRRRQRLLGDVWNDGGHSDEVQGFEVWPQRQFQARI